MPVWDTFTVVLGGAAGALIGLLFVSVSIRIDVIAAIITGVASAWLFLIRIHP